MFIFAGVFILACAGFLTVDAVIKWRNRGNEARRSLAMTIYRHQSDVDRGKARAVVARAATMLCILLMVVSAVAAGAQGGRFGHSPWAWVFGAAAAGMLAGTLLQGAVIYYNRPRFVVPPHLRDEPGALASRRRKTL